MDATKTSPRGIAPPPAGEAITSHWPAPKAPPNVRAAIVRTLSQSEGRGAIGAPDSRGIVLIDIMAEPKSVHLDAAVSATEMTLEAAAFLVCGYVLAEPGRSGEAIERTARAADAGHEGAVEIQTALTWLRAMFGGQGGDDHRIVISPDDLMLALQRPDAPASILPSLLWRAYRLCVDSLRDQEKQFEDKLELERVHWTVELDNGVGGTNGSRSCLYLMAIATGAMKPGEGFHSSYDSIEKKLKDAFKAVKAVQDIRRTSASGSEPLGPVAFKVPVKNTLLGWLRDGAEKIGFDPTQWKDGSPPKKRETALG